MSASASPTHGSWLFLHADDFGMSAGINQGILRGFTHGLITSTSILANGPAFEDACRQWQGLRPPTELPSWPKRQRLDDSHCSFDLGVHLNLTQGRPLTTDRFPRRLLDREGCFPGIGQLFRRLLLSGGRFAEPLYEELRAQIHRLTLAGLRPTHLNGHQYIELLPVVGQLLPELCREFGISIVRWPRERGLWRTTNRPHPRPVALMLAGIKRGFSAHMASVANKLAHPEQFFGTAHAGMIRASVVEQFVRHCHSRSAEIAFHPGDGSREIAAGAWGDPLSPYRKAELDLLQSSELVEILDSRGLRLARLRELAQ